MDNNRLYKVAKKYSSKQKLAQWEMPEKHVSDKINHLLSKNNPTQNNHVEQIIAKIAQNQLYPKNLNVADFDIALQKDKAEYLNNNYSNQTNLIRDLKQSKRAETKELNELKKQVDAFKKSVAQVVRELEEIGGDPRSSLNHDAVVYNNHSVSVNIADIGGNGVDSPEFGAENGSSDGIAQLDKLLDFTVDIRAISSKLDELNEYL